MIYIKRNCLILTIAARGCPGTRLWRTQASALVLIIPSEKGNVAHCFLLHTPCINLNLALDTACRQTQALAESEVSHKSAALGRSGHCMSKR